MSFKPITTFKEFEEEYEDIIKMYPNLPNPKHEPKRFMWHLTLYRWRLHTQNEKNLTSE